MSTQQFIEQDPQELTIEGTQLVSYAQKRFYTSELCKEARERLQDLVNSSEHDTDSTYYKEALAFVDRHLQYISLHPKVNLDGYISNLKLMTSVKRRS
jgi:hypothetical protein